ncbi:MAG: PAS domain S-box protein, partial [Cyclobacteriaceae bacterium]
MIDSTHPDDSLVQLCIYLVFLIFFVYRLFRRPALWNKTSFLVLFYTLLPVVGSLVYGLEIFSLKNNPYLWIIYGNMVVLIWTAFIQQRRSMRDSSDAGPVGNKDIRSTERLPASLSFLPDLIFRSVFYKAELGVVYVDHTGVPIVANKYFQELLQYTPGELSTMKFVEFTHPDDVAENKALFEELISKKRDSFEIEKRYVKKNGDICNVNVFVAREAENQFITIIKNISGKIKLDEELNLQKERLIESGSELNLTKEVLLTTQDNARIGNWEVDMITGETTISKLIYEIYGLPEGYQIEVE